MKSLFLPFLLAAATTAVAQPRIGFIEIYGNRRVSDQRILRAVGAKPGDPLPRSKGEVEEKIEEIGGILRARLEAFCCEEGLPVLYVGVEERGAPAFEYRPIPGEEMELPETIVTAYRDFTAALNRAAAEGDTAEDLSRGHSLMRNVSCRVLQERFVGLAQLHEPALRRVLAAAADPEQRAIAAYVAGYAPDKRTVVDDLQQALRDPDDGVRANAARAMKAIAVLAADPEMGIIVRPTWFVEMLNSVSLSDRLEGARALLTLFDKLSEQTQAQIRERAVRSLEEMARWRHLAHALPSYLLLGRVAGVPDDEIEQSWARGEREAMLKRMGRALRR